MVYSYIRELILVSKLLISVNTTCSSSVGCSSVIVAHNPQVHSGSVAKAAISNFNASNITVNCVGTKPIAPVTGSATDAILVKNV